MEESLKINKKIKLGRTVFPILIIVFTLLSMFYNPDPAHDLFRYYEEANKMKMSDGFMGTVTYYYSQNSDFLYFVAFYFVRFIGLPIQFVNGLFVFLFYYASTQIILDLARWKNVSIKEINHAITFAFCSTPFVFIFSISRNTAALAFLFLSIHYFFNKKYYLLVLYAILAVLTHIGISLYIAIAAFSIAISWVLERFNITKGFAFIAIFIGGGILYMLKDGLNLILQLSFFDTFHYFAQYLEESSAVISLSDASLGTLTTVTLIWVVFIICILALKNQLRYPYNFVLFVLPFLFVSFFMSNMFVQRTLMFMVPFNGCLLLGTIGKFPEGSRLILAAIGVFLNLSILVAINRCFI